MFDTKKDIFQLSFCNPLFFRSHSLFFARKKQIFKLSQGEYVAPDSVEEIIRRSDYVAHVSGIEYTWEGSNCSVIVFIWTFFSAFTGLRPRRLFEVLRNRGGGARPSELFSLQYFLIIFFGFAEPVNLLLPKFLKERLYMWALLDKTYYHFYRTRVRSLAMLVTHSLTHSLTDWLTAV